MGQFNLNILESEPTINGKITQIAVLSSSTYSFILKSLLYSNNSLLSDYNLNGNTFNKLFITNINYISQVSLKYNGTTISTGNIPYQIDISSITNDNDIISLFEIEVGKYIPINEALMFDFYITDSNNTASNITKTIIYLI